MTFEEMLDQATANELERMFEEFVVRQITGEHRVEDAVQTGFRAISAVRQLMTMNQHLLDL